MRVDRNNIEEYFERYGDNVFALSFSYFMDASSADDCVQETFIKLLKSEKEFESEEHIRNWIMKVAINECRRVTLSSWFKKRQPLEEYAETLTFETPEESEVFMAVMKLPVKYRQVTHLFYYEGYSVKEIGNMLGISGTAVTTRLSRARRMLKEQLLEVWQDE